MKQNHLELQAIRIGNKERLMGQNISAFSLVKIKRYPPAHPFYAIITNNDQVYLMDHQFSMKHQKEKTTQNLLHLAYLKVDLRHEYKLPPPLHLKLRYSYNHQCIFLLLSDGNIAIFNYDLYLLQTIKLIGFQKKTINLKYCIDYDYHQYILTSTQKIKNGFFLFLFSDVIEIHEVQIMTNHKLSKYKSSFKLTLTIINRYIIDNKISHPISLTFINGIQQRNCIQPGTYIKKALICNCSKQINFYFLQDDITIIAKKLYITKKNDYGIYITNFELNMNLSKIYLCLNNGILQIYSYKQQMFGKLMTTIKISNSSIMKIYLINTKKMYSYNEDNNLYIINLQTLSVQQQFSIGNYKMIQFLGDHLFIGSGFSFNNGYLDINARHKDQKCLIINIFNVKYHHMIAYSSEIINYHVTDRSSLILFSDNSLIYQPYLNSTNIKEFSTYLPPNTVTVKCLAINPFNKNQDYEQFWVLTDKSLIYKYKFSCSHAPKIEEILQVSKFYDRQNLQLRYCITYFTFLKKIICIQYDSQSTLNDFTSMKRNDVNSIKKKEQTQNICLGTFTGQIIIVSIQKISNIICRLRYLSKPITFIYQIFIYSQNINIQRKGLLIYGSQLANKFLIIQMQQQEIPIEKYRLSIDKLSLKLINNQFLAILNDHHFNLIYFTQNQHHSSCNIYMEEHFTPVLIPNSNLSNLVYIEEQPSAYIISGYSLGQILIYQVNAIDINNKIEIQLSLCYFIQNSSLSPIQYVCYRNQRIIFTLNKIIVEYKLSKKDQQMVSINESNLKINNLTNFLSEYKNTGKMRKEQIKHRRSLNEDKLLSKSISKKQLKYMAVLPKIKQSSISHKKRSSSFNSIYSRRNKQKSDNLFHFPDIFLYRNLIQKNIIN